MRDLDKETYSLLYEIKKEHKDFPNTLTDLIRLLNNRERKQKLIILNERAKN